LLRADFIRETLYPKWLANPVLVKKNGKWRVCIDFTDHNKACPKDSFSPPSIDQIVDATSHELSFMDAYFEYNQINMHPPDEDDKVAFTTGHVIDYYKVMPFGLKNTRATFQRKVNEIFKELIGCTIEVYVDDMLVKSLECSDHVHHLAFSPSKIQREA